MTRLYVPATLTDLAVWHAAGEIPASADRLAAAGDDEDSEYAALLGAADASAALLDGAGRRVVVVVETAAADGPLPVRDVVAVHVDTEDRAPGADPDADLAWYATQEIPGLLAR